MIGLEALAGRRVGPSWDLQRLLARGGMSAVYVGRHAVTQREVAVKVLDPGLFSDPAARDRFVREVTAPARIKHPGIVEVLDAGTDATLGVHFVVMELLDGYDLRRELRDGAVPLDRALTLIDALLDALSAAHRAGVVHRDLKPENVFLAKDGDGRPRVKVLDFGIARDLTGSSATATSTAMGTPYYMAPEQMRSARSVTAAADVWSVGVMLHEMISGKPPFAGETIPAIFVAVATEPPLPLPPGVPERLRAVVAACLDKNVSGRPTDATALREALRAARASRAMQLGPTVASVPPLKPLAPTLPMGVSPLPTVSLPMSSSRSWLVPVGIGAVASLLALVGALVVALGSAGTSAAPPAPLLAPETASAALAPAPEVSPPPAVVPALPPAPVEPAAEVALAPDPTVAPPVEEEIAVGSVPREPAVARSGRGSTAAVPREPERPAGEGRGGDLPDAPTRAQTVAAMGAVAPEISACGGGAHGVALVAVTVAGSTGRVTNATVGGEFAGTPIGSCIARAVRGATFPRFTRPTFTANYPFRI